MRTKRFFFSPLRCVTREMNLPSNGCVDFRSVGRLADSPKSLLVRIVCFTVVKSADFRSKASTTLFWPYAWEKLIFRLLFRSKKSLVKKVPTATVRRSTNCFTIIDSSLRTSDRKQQKRQKGEKKRKSFCIFSDLRLIIFMMIFTFSSEEANFSFPFLFKVSFLSTFGRRRLFSFLHLRT